MEKSKEARVSLMEELLAKEEYQPRSLTRGQIIEGTIISITPKEILVDVGAKAEGIILSREIEMPMSNFKVEEKIFAYVLDPEGDAGQVILSLKRAGNIRSWQILNDALRDKTELKVKPMESNRGGVLVNFEGLRGFIPSSQLQTTLEESLKKDSLTVKVIELDKFNNKIVFSEKDSVNKKKTQDVGKVKQGEIYSGSVSKIASFGLFIILESGVEGLVHVSEIAWEKVFDPASLYKVGDEVTVKVLSTDKELNRINLSIKQATSDPWETAHERYIPGNKVKGMINKVTPTGMVVRLEPGVEGIVNITEEESKKFAVGDKVELVVESLSLETQRVSLKLV